MGPPDIARCRDRQIMDLDWRGNMALFYLMNEKRKGLLLIDFNERRDPPFNRCLFLAWELVLSFKVEIRKNVNECTSNPFHSVREYEQFTSHTASSPTNVVL